MVKILTCYERFYRVSTLIIFSSGLLGRLNLLAENKIGIVLVFDYSGYKVLSIKSVRYKLSKRVYR